MKKFLTVAILFILSLTIVVACQQPDTNNGNGPQTDNVEKTANGGDEKEEVFVNLEGGDDGFPQPFTHYARGPGRSKMQLIFDSLLERGENGPIPWLAEEWELSDDGTAYTFDLREGVKWQDGVKLTAEDVAFSIAYYQEHPPVSNEPMVFEKLDEITVKNEHQIKITTTEPYAPFVEAVGKLRIIPKHIWRGVSNPEQFTDEQALIGTGPYQLTDYSEGHGTYRYKANSAFWGPDPQVDVIQFVPVSDEVMALQNNDIDLAEIPVDVLPQFEDNSDYKIVERPGLWGYRLLLNMEDVPELSDRQVRQALAYTIDRDNLVNSVGRGEGIPGNMGLLPPDHHMHNPDVKEYQHDPTKAKGMIAEADVMDDDEQLSITLIVGNESKEVRIGELVREDLQQIGIDVDINSVDSKTRDNHVTEQNYQMALIGHGGWGNDADDYFIRRFEGLDDSGIHGKLPGYANDDVDRISEKQRVEMNPETREELIYEVQEIWSEDIPEIPLYYTTAHYVYDQKTYDNWTFVFDHHSLNHFKISYLNRDGGLFDEDK